MHKRTRRILTGMVITVVAIGTVYAVALVRSTAKLRQAYAALEKDGRPMNPAEVLPPEVPDMQNAAVLYEKAASLLRAQPAERKNLLEYLGDLSSSFVNDSLKPERLAEFRQLMGQEVVASALATVEQGTQRPTCRLNRDYRTAPLKEMPITADLRNLARILGARACIEAEAGEPQRAWNTVRIQLRLADALRSDPTFMGQLAHWSMTRYSCITIRRLCETISLTNEESQVIETLLSGMDDTAALVHAVDGERLLRGEWLFNLPEDQLYKALRNDPMVGHSRLFFRFLMLKPRFIADHAAYLQLMHRCTQLVQRPFSPQDADTQHQIGKLASRHFLTDRLGLARLVSICKEFHCRMIAEVNMTRAGLAALQYKQAHGAFPQTLDALGLKGLIDPFTQEPLHYRAEDKGFVFYSVGEDLKDNGGNPHPRQHSEPSKQPVEYDLVWRFPRPPDKAD